MERTKNNSGRMTGKLAIAAMAILISSSALFAQNGSSQNLSGEESAVLKLKTNQCALKNMAQCIKSSNRGVKRNAIYLAGKYGIHEAAEPLMDQLKKENEGATRILIALSLYKIGDAKGIALIKKLAGADDNQEVRRMCAAIYNEFAAADSTYYANK